MTLEGIPQGYYVFDTDGQGRIIKSTFRFYHEDIGEHVPSPLRRHRSKQHALEAPNLSQSTQTPPKIRFSR